MQTPKQILTKAFLRPEYEDSLIVTIRDKIAEAKRFRHLRVELMNLLSDEVHEMKLEDVARTYPGMVTELYRDTP
jgi:hypothetical protein